MRYILFVRENCTFCVKAQALLNKKNLDYKVIDFAPEQDLILKEIKDAYQWDTVPMIFQRNGDLIKFIGGYTGLAEHLGNE
jgi:glutaredoxin